MKNFLSAFLVLSVVVFGAYSIVQLDNPTLQAQVSSTDLFTTDTLVWGAAPGATSYDIRMVLQGGTPSSSVVGEVLGHTNTTLSAASLVGAATNGVIYDIFVRANNANGSGEWSDPFTVTVFLVPPKVTGVTKQ